ncbi:MAG: hypothetical protein RLZZ621_829 [Gemmatimonadota bacterium]
MPADEFDPEEQDESPDDDESVDEGRPAVFVTTREPITVSIAQLDDPRAP